LKKGEEKNTVHFFFAELLRRAPASDGEKLEKTFSTAWARGQQKSFLIFLQVAPSRQKKKSSLQITRRCLTLVNTIYK
jgi:hypothetical protein